MSDRAPCINPRCRRTYKVEFEGAEVICGRCFRTLPAHLRDQHRRYWREYRKWGRRILRTSDPLKALRMRKIQDRWAALIDRNWAQVRNAVLAPAKPVGLDAFLDEVGLTERR